jgi:hypothetical protein
MRSFSLFNALENLIRLIILKISPFWTACESKPHSLLLIFRRETYQVGTLFWGKHDTSFTALESQRGSAAFQTFLNTVGWIVALPQHTGYMGGLDLKNSGPVTPYFSSHMVEVIFAAASLIPNTHPQKRQLVTGNEVLIAWVEDLSQFALPNEWNCSLCIVVHPLPSKLFLLQLWPKKASLARDTPMFGPILHNMVVGPQLVPLMVRETAINAARLLRDELVTPITLRKIWIEEFVQKFKIEHSVSQYLASQLLC